ncbi:peptidylprolyl isomerase [Paludifilum halophilum]|nr:peptidylprolyl isomerase [Paludifilum halophilum]
MRPIKRRLATAMSALLAVSLFAAGCGSGDDGKDQANEQDPSKPNPLPTTSKKVVAEYEGGKVREGELNLYLNIMSFFQPQIAPMLDNAEAKKEIVKQYIAERLIVEKVKDDKKYDKAADKALKDFEEQLKQAPAQEGEEKKDPEEVLKESGIKKDELRTFLKNNNKVSDYFEDKVKEKDLKKEYEKSDAYQSITLNHVLISTKDPQTQEEKRSDKEAKKRAEKVQQQLEDGAKFKEVAKKYSDDPGSKDGAGEIEGSPDQWDPAFAEAAQDLPLDEISDPIKSQFGYHVMKVKERGKQPYDEVKDQIKEKKIQEMYQKFIEDEVEVKKMDLPGDEDEKKSEEK